MDDSGMQSLQDVQSLICSSCWQKIFNTEAYGQLCVCQCTERYCRHDVNVRKSAREIQESASRGCNWCSYIYTFTSKDGPDENPEDLLSIHLSNFFPEFSTPKGKNTYYLSLDWDDAVSNRGNGWALRLHAFTSCEDPAAPSVTAREIQTEVHSEKSKLQIRDWLGECVGHVNCPAQTETELPTRVIEVPTPGSSENPRVIKTNGNRGKYAALSYCWGNDVDGGLKLSNLDYYSQQFDTHKLSQTLRDALGVAADIGVPYLWVDSLCIIQDSEDDKRHEMSAMERIYKDSLVTIVAANSKSAADGFLQPRKEPPRSYRIPFCVSKSKFGTMSVWELDAREYDESSEAINQRAWTLQEGFLANRYLVYSSHTLQWRCSGGVKNLGDSLHLVSYAEEEEYSESLYTLRTPTTDAAKELSRWIRIVHVYSRRSASYPHDKLNAIAAVASTFSEFLGPQYSAGIWQHRFLWQLTWVTHASWSSDARNVRPKVYRAPTWSWASMDGGLSYEFILHNKEQTFPFCKFISCKVWPKSESFLLGEVLRASLTLEVVLRQAWFIPSDNSVVWNENSDEGPKVAPSLAKLGLDESSDDDRSSKYNLRDKGYHDESGDWPPMTVFGLPLIVYDNLIDMGLLIVPTSGGRFMRIGTFSNTDRKWFNDLPEREIMIV